MNQPIELRPEVLAFARLMEQRLREKDADKGIGWKGMSSQDLMVSAISKTRQLESSVYGTSSSNRYAVDLANYCMMIADVSGVLELPPQAPVEKWGRDDEQTYCVLLLIGGHNVTQEAIASWSDEQCQQVEEWALSIHLQASDNDDVEVPRVPPHVIPFLER